MQFLKNNRPPLADEEYFVSERSECEIAPGVVLERRVILGGGLGLLAMLLTQPEGLLGQERNLKDAAPVDSEGMELEDLISKLRPQARKMIASETPDEENYIVRAMEELKKVNKLEAINFHSHKKGLEMDFTAYVHPLLLYQIRMSPNTKIDLHDHRYHNGALSVREGNVRVRSFDIFQGEGSKKWDVAAGKVPAMEEEFLIQEKGESVLKQGQAIGLTRTRDNIHQIEAGPDGCLMYDLFTNFKFNAQSFAIKWDGKYFDNSKKLCKVLWIPPDHTHE